MHRRLLPFVAIVLSLATRGHAHAQSAEAEATFADGDKLMAAGQIAQACDAFEASNKAEPRAGTLIRLGECREKNHQLASAWAAYKDALTRAKDPRKRAAAQTKVHELEPQLSYLTISVPDESRIDGLAIARNSKLVDTTMWNRAVPVDGGQYIIVGRAPGHEEWQTTVEVPVEHGKITVDVPKFKDLAKLITTTKDAPAITTQTTPPPTPIDRDEPERGPWTGRRKLAVGIAAGGAAVLVVGIVLGTQASARQSSADALCPDPLVPCANADQANSLNQAGQDRALGANLAFGVAAVAAIGAGVLWFTGAPAERHHHVAIAPMLGHGEARAVGVVIRAPF